MVLTQLEVHVAIAVHIGFRNRLFFCTKPLDILKKEKAAKS